MTLKEGIPLAFLIIICVTHFFVLIMQYYYQSKEPETTRFIVLSTRTSMFLPFYALFIWISYVKPESFEAMVVLINIVEGFTFYIFFTLLVTNIGGSNKTLNVINSKSFFLFQCCFPKNNMEKFYNRTSWLMFHCLVTRPILTIIGAIGSYSGTKAGQILFLLISVLCAIIIIVSIIHLVNFYEMIFEQSRNLFGVLKLFLLKFSVTIIVFQGLIANFLISTHKGPYSDDDGDDKFDETEKTIRGYCALVLIELLIISIPYFYAYGYVQIQPSQAPEYDSKSHPPHSIAYASFCSYYMNIWALWDVYGVIRLNPNDTTTVFEPLLSDEKSNNTHNA